MQKYLYSFIITLGLIIIPFVSNSQEGNIIGLSKKTIETQMIEGNIKLLSEKKGEQQFIFDGAENQTYLWLLILSYDKHNYCTSQSHIVRVSALSAEKMEGILLRHLCKEWRKIGNDKVSCGSNVICFNKKDSPDGAMVTFCASWGVK